MNARENFRPFTDPEEFERIIEKDTVTEMWRDCLRDYADREAIVFRDTACTYEELERDAAAFRAVLLQQIDGGRVGILCANSYDFVKAFIAVTTLGMTAVILPAHLDARSVFGCCMRFQLDALVYQPELDSQLDIVREKLDDLRAAPRERASARFSRTARCCREPSTAATAFGTSFISAIC